MNSDLIEPATGIGTCVSWLVVHTAGVVTYAPTPTNTQFDPTAPGVVVLLPELPISTPFAGPVAPIAPLVPLVPLDPVAPVGPVAPAVPLVPLDPVAPVAPVAPADPLVPFVPLVPFAPVAP